MNLAVFVSSTSEDLEDYRAVARQVILDMDCTPRMMEHFAAITRPTVQACKDKLAECQLMVLIVAFRQGWVPTREQGGNGTDSITALELQFARQRNIPVLAMMANTQWPGDRWEDQAEKREWVTRFRNDLNLPAAFFSYEPPTTRESERLPDFRGKLHKSMLDFREEQLKKHAQQVRAAGPIARRSDGAIKALRSGRCIPFLGAGMYGEGALSTTALIEALGRPDSHEPSLATAAEYHERGTALSRADFLLTLDEIIQRQTPQAVIPPVHELLRRHRPQLIISATCDLSLEKQLEAQAEILIVCHIVRSPQAEHDGKIAVFRGTEDAAPRLYSADKVELGEVKDKYVVYKPQGSPLLHRRMDADAILDTVVLTEADHLALFGRLENQCTGIPTAFSRYFHHYPFIFLGYPMDVWHYRLIVHVFRTIGQPQSGLNHVAVRIPASQMERVAWERLGIQLLEMDANDLAGKALEAEAAPA